MSTRRRTYGLIDLLGGDMKYLGKFSLNSTGTKCKFDPTGIDGVVYFSESDNYPVSVGDNIYYSSGYTRYYSTYDLTAGTIKVVSESLSQNEGGGSSGPYYAFGYQDARL